MTKQTLVDYLATRRTIPAAQLGAPGPDAATLQAMLTIAARVPDHGKLAPWRFVLFDVEGREEVGSELIRLAERHPDEAERRQRVEKAKGFRDAPQLVCVVSTGDPDHPKIPLWEQQLSAGAVCLNLLHAAAAHGFAAQWLTNWYAYDQDAMHLFGLKDDERVAGLIHIGTPKLPPTERDRPDMEAITSLWRKEG